MPAVNPTQYHLSASAIAAFKACPTRFRLAYREGIRSAADTESQRVGSSWHAMHEVYANELVKHCPDDGDTKEQYALAGVVHHLNERYAKVPSGMTLEEWALERTILLTSFIGYQWYYSNDPVETIASELAFDLPVHMPKTGLPLPMSEVKRVGKIDHVIRWQGMVGVQERKSTTRSIEPESDYWDKSKKDTQVSMYALAFRDMKERGLDAYGITVASNERFGNTLYDVWHRPTIKPKMLTQADTKTFIETGTYFDQQFEVVVLPESEHDRMVPVEQVRVDGEKAEIEPGKKGFAIRETVGMYAARLMNDIYTRPEFYFARREIARTDAEVVKFRRELFAHYQNMKLVEKYGSWTENEQQCRATFPCPYIPICYGPGADAVCDGKTTPNGFKRIFVDLTVKGEAIDE